MCEKNFPTPGGEMEEKQSGRGNLSFVIVEKKRTRKTESDEIAKYGSQKKSTGLDSLRSITFSFLCYADDCFLKGNF